MARKAPACPESLPRNRTSPLSLSARLEGRQAPRHLQSTHLSGSAYSCAPRQWSTAQFIAVALATGMFPYHNDLEEHTAYTSTNRISRFSMRVIGGDQSIARLTCHRARQHTHNAASPHISLSERRMVLIALRHFDRCFQKGQTQDSSQPLPQDRLSLTLGCESGRVSVLFSLTNVVHCNEPTWVSPFSSHVPLSQLSQSIKPPQISHSAPPNHHYSPSLSLWV